MIHTPESTRQAFAEPPGSSASAAKASTTSDARPLVSVVLPAYNEAAILEQNLTRLCRYLETLEAEYRWEIVIVNDGSRDDTGAIAERFASQRENVRVFHHPTNFGLGQAFKFAFGQVRGDYVVTFDVDLSYAPEHIGLMLQKIRATGAKIVLASPYMEGGTFQNVPRLRRVLSVWANRFLGLFAQGRLSTLTCMVRAHDAEFLRGLNIRAMGMEVMPEMVYKAMILRARIEQVPAHLDWGPQLAAGPKRRSSMRLLRHTIATLLAGFIFRPFIFFIAPGLVLLLFSLYVNTWMFIHFFRSYFDASLDVTGTDRLSVAVAAAYAMHPHTFIVGLLSLMLAIQMIGLGILALQSKNYFEEMFHLASAAYRKQNVRGEGKK